MRNIFKTDIFGLCFLQNLELCLQRPLINEYGTYAKEAPGVDHAMFRYDKCLDQYKRRSPGLRLDRFR